MLLGLDSHPALQGIMSRDGRRLRNDVLEYAYTHGTQGRGTQECAAFKQQLIDQYKPLNFERAVLYAHPADAFEALCRATSGAFQERREKKPDTRGVVRGARARGLDWLEIAQFDPKWWLPACDDPRSTPLRVHPDDFPKCLDVFAPMYEACTKWLPVDFSFTTLAKIWDAAKRYDLGVVKECMDRILDPEHKRIDYLLAVVENQVDLDEVEMAEFRGQIDQSKAILDTVAGIAHQPHQPVDWDSLESEAEIIKQNELEFEKVKLS